jgi:hypothetical protein
MIVVPEARGTVELSGRIANARLWKLPQVWKHRTLPHLLGNHTLFPQASTRALSSYADRRQEPKALTCPPNRGRFTGEISPRRDFLRTTSVADGEPGLLFFSGPTYILQDLGKSRPAGGLHSLIF